MFKSIIVACSLYLTVVSSQERQCGQSLLIGPVGWFASPKWLSNFRGKTVCEWEIHVKDGDAVRIEIVDFQTNGNDDGIFAGKSYIRIFDADDESTSKYFSRYTMMRTGNRNPTFFSKTNVVIVELVSEGQSNSISFNATYEALNRANFCDIAQLSLEGSIEFDATKCQSEGLTNHFKSCDVTCSQGYTTKTTAKVQCENGKFLPEKPCALIDMELKLCLITDLQHCIYTLGELENHMLSRTGIPSEDNLNFDPRLDEATDSGVQLDQRRVVAPSKAQVADTNIVLGRRRMSFQQLCTAGFRRGGLCAKDGEGKYAFNCNEYRNRNLPIKIAAKLKERCLLCRFHACTRRVPYI